MWTVESAGSDLGLAYPGIAYWPRHEPGPTGAPRATAFVTGAQGMPRSRRRQRKAWSRAATYGADEFWRGARGVDGNTGETRDSGAGDRGTAADSP